MFSIFFINHYLLVFLEMNIWEINYGALFNEHILESEWPFFLIQKDARCSEHMQKMIFKKISIIKIYFKFLGQIFASPIQKC